MTSTDSQTASLSPTVAVIGYGRFGHLWASILSDDFEVIVYDNDDSAASAAASNGHRSVSLLEALSAPAIFYSVPISAFEKTLKEHMPTFAGLPGPRTLIDLLSVKSHPRDVFERLLPEGYEALLAHPMFGPDSVASNGLAGQTLVLDRFRTSDATFGAWKQYFESKHLTVVEMPADEHDRIAANSQGITHFVGRMLERVEFSPTAIDTVGSKKLHEITGQVCNDTWQLFVDLQTYNPHTPSMRTRLSKAHQSICDQLIPNRRDSERLTIGIQGGRGSFNEEAAGLYMARTPEVAYKLDYLHTTQNVLRALEEGSTDRGIFAIHNSLGRLVDESLLAMSQFRFNVLDKFSVPIAHALMVVPGTDPATVDTVMAHPQALAQCNNNLTQKYPHLKLTSGQGDLIDHAKVAELLACGELPPTTATLGSKLLAEIYGLDIVEENLQDMADNQTTFLWVERS